MLPGAAPRTVDGHERHGWHQLCALARKKRAGQHFLGAGTQPRSSPPGSARWIMCGSSSFSIGPASGVSVGRAATWQNLRFGRPAQTACLGASDRPYMNENKKHTCVAGGRVSRALATDAPVVHSSLRDRLLSPLLRLFGAHSGVAKPQPRLRRSRRVPQAAMAPGHVATGASKENVNATPSKRPAAQSLMTQSTRKRAKGTCCGVSRRQGWQGGCAALGLASGSLSFKRPSRASATPAA